LERLTRELIEEQGVDRARVQDARAVFSKKVCSVRRVEVKRVDSFDLAWFYREAMFSIESDHSSRERVLWRDDLCGAVLEEDLMIVARFERAP
jgi:hypothetical protein